MNEPLEVGKYRLVRRIAVGGMAEILLASIRGEAGFERPIIIKKILPQHAGEEEFARRLIDEGLLASRLTHGNIVQVLDLGKLGPDYFIAMELVDGPDLRGLLQRAAARKFEIPVPIAVHVLWNVARALAYAHDKKDEAGQSLNIIHRDISPANVILSWEGEIKLTDFGIAKAALSHTRTLTGVLQGKFPYMSPEQAEGLDVDQRSDIFSFGSLAYELLTLARPFQGESDLRTLERVRQARVPPMERLRPSLPAELVAVVQTCLQKDPDKRYASGHSMERALAAILQKEGWVVSQADVADFLDMLYGADKQSWTVATTPDPDLPSERFDPAPVTARKLEPPSQRTPAPGRGSLPEPGQFTRSVVMPVHTVTRTRRLFWPAWTVAMVLLAAFFLLDYFELHLLLGRGDGMEAATGGPAAGGPAAASGEAEAGPRPPVPGPGEGQSSEGKLPHGSDAAVAAPPAPEAHPASHGPLPAAPSAAAGASPGAAATAPAVTPLPEVKKRPEAGAPAEGGARPGGADAGGPSPGGSGQDGGLSPSAAGGPEAAGTVAADQRKSRTTRVVVEPADAHVFVNGKDRGVSPVDIELAEGQKADVRIEKPGFAAETLVVEHGGPPQVSRALVPVVTGKLVLRFLPASAEVLIDGRRVETSSSMNILDLDLPEGPHQVTVRAGDKEITETASIIGGKPWKRTIDLTR
jgi:serine/threonine-protein kinase